MAFNADSGREPIAIVGISLKFPSDAKSTESFWSMLLDGRCVSRDFPKDRLNEALFHPDSSRTDSIPLRGGHFIDEPLGAFDAPFFSITAAEAVAMDPQSRALLETTYRALENAGQPIGKVSGTNTSVYTGNLSTDWRSTMVHDLEQSSRYSLHGLSSLLAGRISWFFNLTGQCLTLDTACSSSLVALDLGCNSLLSKESNMSIVTGCCLLHSPELFYLLSGMNMLSPDSKCYSFDHRGNGYGRGEGIAALVLKRLPDAIRDGDTIRGIIRSTGTNQDGHTPGVSQPSKKAQIKLIKDTYAKCNLDMTPTRYFEAHGTGTPVGDPIEANAIGSAFRGSRSSSDPLYVGSVKSNIGHLEGASGLAGVIKAMLVLENGVIPPAANFETLNPRIDAAGLNIQIPTRAIIWPTKGLRRASVNSFGASGTNAHAVLDDVYHTLCRLSLQGNHNTVAEPSVNSSRLPAFLPAASDSSSNHSRILFLSASNKATLPHMINQFSHWLSERKASGDITATLVDQLVYTLAERRSSLPWKSFALLRTGEVTSDLSSRMSLSIRSQENPKLGFVFTGQGAQWCGMGKELLNFPLFLDSILESQEYLETLGFAGSLTKIMKHSSEPCDFDRPEQSQLICTVLQVALTDFFRGLDLYPVGVIGHSSGEIAAAYCAGAISKISALRLAYFRGTLSERIRSRDDSRGMMAVGISTEKTQSIIAQISLTATLTIACINSRKSVTVSGPRIDLQCLAGALKGAGIFHRILRVDVAYHSPQMEAVAELYAQNVGSLDLGMQQKKRVVMISSVSGKFEEHEDLCQIDYWVQNMLQPVRFSDALTRLCGTPSRDTHRKLDGLHRQYVSTQFLVEIGPHAALQGPIRETLDDLDLTTDVGYYSVLRRNTSAETSVMETLGYLKCHGFNVNLEKVNQLEKCSGHPPVLRRVLHNLPEYPFNHSERYWPQGRLGTEFRFRRNQKLDLLGKPVIDWNPLEPRWTNFLKLHELPWAADHQIHGTVIYPAAGMIVMAVEAAKQLADPQRGLKGFKLANIHCKNALIIPATTEGLESHLHFHRLPVESTRHAPSWSFHLYSVEDGNWHEHCHGQIQLEYTETVNEINGEMQHRQALHEHTQAHLSVQNKVTWHKTPEQFYSSAWKSGYTFGPALRVMENILFTNETSQEVTADVKCFEWEPVNNTNHYQEHVVHPTTLDGVFQPAVAVYCRAGEDIMSTAVPIEIQSMWISNAGLSYPRSTRVKSRARLVQSSITGYETTVTALDKDSEKVLVNVRGLKLQFISGNSAINKEPHIPKLGYSVHCRPDISMLEARDLPHVVQSTIGEEYTTDSAQHIIKRILELAFFKSPGLKILHIIQSVNDPTKTILDELFPRESSNSNSLQCDEYVLADASEGTSTPEAKMYERVTIVEWKNISSERAGYDIVLVPCSVREDTLPRLFSLIKKGGRALLFNPDKCNHQRHDLRENSILPFESGVNGAIANVQVRESALIEIGFASVISVPCMKPNESPLVIAEKPFHRSASDAMNLVLVMDCTSMYQQALADHLRSQRSMNIQTKSVEDLAKTDSKHLHPETVYVFLYEIEKPLLASLSQETFYALRKILLLATRILWITSRDQNGVLNPDFAMIDGLARVIRSENHNTTVMTARLEWNTPEHQASMIMRLIRNTDFGIAGQDYESEYSVVDGTVCVQRVYPAKSLSQEISDGREFSTSNTMERAFGAGPPLKMVVGTPGLLDSLHFVEDISTKDPIAGDEVEIKVHAAGLNFKDLLIALGRVEGTGIGIECAGTIARCGEHVDGLVPGDRVICLCNAAFSTYVRAKGASLARLPPGPSMEHAAAIPVQFGTAYYAIHVMAKLQRGETILIHSGAGGTGQASIQIAQHLGGEVFVTVSSNGKKELLMVRYGIPESHIFYSRDASFAEGILQVTNGRGVDVVLNSLAGESLLASWDVIAPYGRFIELGKKDINQNSSLPMRPFSRGASFMHLETTAITADNPELVRNVLDELLALFAEQKLQPVHQLQTFPISDLQKGLQILQSGNSIGKLAFQMDDGAMVKTRLSGFQQARLNPEKTYVIAGGTGGLGLATAIWMVKKKGARNLLLLSRSGLRNPAAMNAVEDLRREGANVEAPECDICDDLALKSTLKSYEGVLPAFGGCIQACMVLKDAIFSNLSYDEWKESTEPKTKGSWNLHTRLPKGLDFFILLSSIAGVVGSAGQANYAAGNTYMDALAHYRIAQGENAVALDLGVMLDHGALALDESLRERILAAGYLTGVTQAEYFRLLEYYCDSSRRKASSDGGQFAIGFASSSKLRKNIAMNGSTPLSLPLYRHIYHDGNRNHKDENGDTENPDQSHHRRAFVQAKSNSEAEAIVSEALFHRLAKSLPSVSSSASSRAEFLSKPLHSYGVDSLMAIEVRSWLAKEFAADVPIFEILGDATISSLCRSTALKSTLRSAVKPA